VLTLGVRGRLLLAFLGIATFSLVAAASGLVSLSLVGNALTKVTDERVPQALSWLELSSQAERVVRAAPALLVVTTEEARDEVSTEIASQAEQLDKYLEKIRNYSPEKRNLEVERIAALIRRLNANLVSLDELVKQRIAISKDKENRVRQLTQVNSVAQRMVAPGKRILEGEIVEWNRQLESNESSQLSQKQDKLARSIIGLVPQQKVAVLFESAHNALLTVSEAKSASGIDVQLFPLKRILTDLAELTESIPKRVKERFVKQLGLLEALVVGPTSLAQVRKSELAVIAEAEELLVVNENLSKFLTQKVGLLIQDANSDIATPEAGLKRFKTSIQMSWWASHF
jgi:hypothetical protein